MPNPDRRGAARPPGGMSSEQRERWAPIFADMLTRMGWAPTAAREELIVRIAEALALREEFPGGFGAVHPAGRELMPLLRRQLGRIDAEARREGLVAGSRAHREYVRGRIWEILRSSPRWRREALAVVDPFEVFVRDGLRLLCVALRIDPNWDWSDVEIDDLVAMYEAEGRPRAVQMLRDFQDWRANESEASG